MAKYACPSNRQKILLRFLNYLVSTCQTGCIEKDTPGVINNENYCTDHADYVCSQKHPSTDAAKCWKINDESSCCKKAKLIRGRYRLSQCLSDCEEDPTVCPERHPSTRAAKCGQDNFLLTPPHKTCCVAEFVYT